MGLVHNCSRCGAEMRPYDEVIDQPQPCRKCLNEDIERLQAIVDKLSKTADGVPVVPGMDVWLPGYPKYPGEVEADAYGVNPCVDWPEKLYHPCKLYSTREAAEVARCSRASGGETESAHDVRR